MAADARTALGIDFGTTPTVAAVTTATGTQPLLFDARFLLLSAVSETS
ncbi:hypothetical protein AB0H83_46580 [Dactylosporangium sp. NPDC050688]